MQQTMSTVLQGISGIFEDFPGCPVVKTPSFHCKGMGLILVLEIRSHVLCDMTKKKKGIFEGKFGLCWNFTYCADFKALSLHTLSSGKA